MAKSRLKEEFHQLEHAIIETFLAGHKQDRPDLSYPESHSDMQSGIRALLIMFDIKRKPLAIKYSELFEENDRNQD